MHANNETGVLFDLPALAGVAHAAGVPVHTDAVQSFGKVPVRVPDLGVDLLSLSGHKIGGPAGSGALYVRSGVRLAPRLLGGSQERERRAGTENLAAAVGLVAAAELAVAEREAEAARLCALRDTLEARVQERIPGVAVNGGGPPRLPQTSNLAFPGVEAEELLVALDLAGFACSAGAACSSGALEPSHVLRAMGLPPERVRGSIRVSLGRATTAEEVDALAEALPALVARCRG
jgi:cysteine desulfurase